MTNATSLIKGINPELDTTRFVNIDDKPFDIFIGGKVVRHLEPQEGQITTVHVAEVGAKHLVDRILQEKHNVRDTMKDTPLRRSLFAKILPDMADKFEVKPLSDEEELSESKKILALQKKLEDSLAGVASQKQEVEGALAKANAQIEKLTKTVEKLLSKKPAKESKTKKAASKDETETNS